MTCQYACIIKGASECAPLNRVISEIHEFSEIICDFGRTQDELPIAV